MNRLQAATLVAFVFACQFPSYTVQSRGEPAGGTGAAVVDDLPGQGGGVMSAPDPCETSPCENEGRCVATLAGSYVCLCDPGFRGERCELAFDNCDPDPCQHGGTCVATATAPYCDCAAGYEGATCERERDDCIDQPCLNGATCVDGLNTRSCECAPGFEGEDCGAGLLPTCRAILDENPEAFDGVYAVDPDGPGQGEPPLDVVCDMSHGGWTLVAQEHEGQRGTLKFLGVSVGDPTAAARDDGDMLIGERFSGLYQEVWNTWSNDSDAGDGIFFRVNEEMFANTVRLAMPLEDFFTTNQALADWVDAAGGAVLCRASRSPDVRPGDTSWAIKPRDDTNDVCGCNDPGWAGRGAFYGGHSDQTSCNPSSGGWTGVADNGQIKSSSERWRFQIWIR